MTLTVALTAGAGGVLGTALGREFSAAGYTAVGLVGDLTPRLTQLSIS